MRILSVRNFGAIALLLLALFPGCIDFVHATVAGRASIVMFETSIKASKAYLKDLNSVSCPNIFERVIGDGFYTRINNAVAYLNQLSQ